MHTERDSDTQFYVLRELIFTFFGRIFLRIQILNKILFQTDVTLQHVSRQPQKEDHGDGNQHQHPLRELKGCRQNDYHKDTGHKDSQQRPGHNGDTIRAVFLPQF